MYDGILIHIMTHVDVECFNELKHSNAYTCLLRKINTIIFRLHANVQHFFLFCLPKAFSTNYDKLLHSSQTKMFDCLFSPLFLLPFLQGSPVLDWTVSWGYRAILKDTIQKKNPIFKLNFFVLLLSLSIEKMYQKSLYISTSSRSRYTINMDSLDYLLLSVPICHHS